MQTKHMPTGATTYAAPGSRRAAAVAARSDENEAEQALLGDAAERLGVTAGELRMAT
jgi:hypothetical protein